MWVEYVRVAQYVVGSRPYLWSFSPETFVLLAPQTLLLQSTQSRIRRIDWKKVCMTSAKLHVF